jgi:hypothetical protein
MMTSNVAQGLLNDRRIALTAGGFARADFARADFARADFARNESERNESERDCGNAAFDFDVDGPAMLPGTTDPPVGSSAAVVIGRSSPDAAS